MDSILIDQLDKKIRDMLTLIVTLRAEKETLGKELGELRGRLGQAQAGETWKGSAKQQGDAFAKELERLKEERKKVRQIIRSVLARIEAIRLEQEKVQEDLFNPEQ